MSQVVIENPVLNSPFHEASSTSSSIRTASRTRSSTPVASRPTSCRLLIPKKKGKQLQLDTEWTRDRIEENKFIIRTNAEAPAGDVLADVVASSSRSGRRVLRGFAMSAELFSQVERQLATLRVENNAAANHTRGVI